MDNPYFANMHKQPGDPGTMTIQDFEKWLRERDAFVAVQRQPQLDAEPLIIVDVISARDGVFKLPCNAEREEGVNRYTAPTLDEALRLMMHDVDAQLALLIRKAEKG